MARTDQETAGLIRLAAIELGADGNALLPNGGNDDVQTPLELARAISKESLAVTDACHFTRSG